MNVSQNPGVGLQTQTIEPDTAKMIIPTKIFSTSVVEVKVTQGSLTVHAEVVTIPVSFITF